MERVLRLLSLLATISCLLLLIIEPNIKIDTYIIIAWDMLMTSWIFRLTANQQKILEDKNKSKN